MRLFVAVVPPDEVLDVVEALPRPDVAGLRWSTRDQWHVTLRFLGEVGEDQLGEARAAVAVAAGSVDGPLEALLGPTVGRFGRRVLHVPVHGLDRLAAATVAATAGIGQPPEDRPFAGHLTLARSRDRRGADLAALAATPIAARWTVHHLELVRSHLGPHGSRYEVLARPPLGADEGR